MFNYNKDFYPTPDNVIAMMGIDCYEKTVLEPQAGKGNIVEWLQRHGAAEVLAMEFDKDLAEIVKSKAKFLGHDFLELQAEQVSHIQMIVMNPPFSNGDKHLLKAWEIAPPGCEIISLLNHATYDNQYTRSRKEMDALIKTYGSIENIGGCFDEAERETEVEIALVKLYKPQEEGNEFDGFFMDEDEEPQGDGIMRYDAVRDVVNSYVGAVKCFDEHKAIADKMGRFTQKFNVGTFGFYVSHDKTVYTKEDFRKELQKKSWTYLFSLLKLDKYLTQGVMKDINKFVENQQKVPFTMRNVYKMFEIIRGTSSSIFDRALVEAVECFTRHTDENRYNVEGWKTNAGHLLNKKIVIPCMVEVGYSGQLKRRYGRYDDNLNDLIKVMCNVEGKNFDSVPSFGDRLNYAYMLYDGDEYVRQVGTDWGFSNAYEEILNVQKKAAEAGRKLAVRHTAIEFGVWMDWGFFKLKGFKKGTVHLQFKDEKVWARLNQRYAKIKGQVLPEKF